MEGVFWRRRFFFFSKKKKALSFGTTSLVK